MSERHAIEIPGSAYPISPETFRLHKEDGPLMRRILALSGIDPSGELTPGTLSDAHIIELTPGAQAVSEE